jgi:hypothetical protein
MSETDVAANSSVATTQADSSPAPLNHQEVLNGLSSEQRMEWRKTGKLPDSPPKEDSASSESKPQTDASAASSETAPDSESGKSTQDKRPKKHLSADERIAQLEATIEKIRQSQGRSKEQPTEKSAAPSPVQPKVEAPKLEAPKKPNIKDFPATDEGFIAYENARDKYVEDLTEFKKQEAIQEFQRNAQFEYQRQKINQEFAEGRQRYKEFDQIAQPVLNTLLSDKEISNEVKEPIGRSPVFVDLLYVIGEKEADRDAFVQLAKSDPWAAVRRAIIMEQLITEELAKQREGKTEVKAEPQRDEKGQFQAAPEKKVTGAPPPPAEVGGTAAAPGDKVKEAVQKRDFATYKAEQNRREMASRRG